MRKYFNNNAEVVHVSGEGTALTMEVTPIGSEVYFDDRDAMNPVEALNQCAPGGCD